MDWMYLFVGALVFVILWFATQAVSEYSIGHFEGRRNMRPKIPYNGVRKWAYMKGHKRGVKRGR